MKNLSAKIVKENTKRVLDFTATVNKAVTELELKQYAYTSNYITKAIDNKNLPLADLKTAILKRYNKQNETNLQKNIKELENVFNSGDLQSVKIIVEWSKSKTWGANPTAEMWVSFKNTKGDNDSIYIKSRSVTGCGYDKLSTAVAEVLNQSNEVLKALYKEADRAKNKKLTNREIFGYGSGYGVLPQIESGVGVSCYTSIFKKIGFNFEQTASGKAFDCFTITKIK